MSASTAYTQKSYWLNTYGPYTPNEPLRGDLAVDIAIIGGGYTGLATAYFLKRAEPALRVAVLEGEVVGYGASGRNGGFAMTLELMSDSSCARGALPAGTTYTPSRSTPEPASFSARHRRMRNVELRVGRLRTRASKLCMALYVSQKGDKRYEKPLTPIRLRPRLPSQVGCIRPSRVQADTRSTKTFRLKRCSSPQWGRRVL